MSGKVDYVDMIMEPVTRSTILLTDDMIHWNEIYQRVLLYSFSCISFICLIIADVKLLLSIGKNIELDSLSFSMCFSIELYKENFSSFCIICLFFQNKKFISVDCLGERDSQVQRILQILVYLKFS